MQCATNRLSCTSVKLWCIVWGRAGDIEMAAAATFMLWAGVQPAYLHLYTLCCLETILYIALNIVLFKTPYRNAGGVVCTLHWRFTLLDFLCTKCHKKCGWLTFAPFCSFSVQKTVHIELTVELPFHSLCSLPIGQKWVGSDTTIKVWFCSLKVIVYLLEGTPVQNAQKIGASPSILVLPFTVLLSDWTQALDWNSERCLRCHNLQK